MFCHVPVCFINQWSLSYILKCASVFLPFRYHSACFCTYPFNRALERHWHSVFVVLFHSHHGPYAMIFVSASHEIEMNIRRIDVLFLIPMHNRVIACIKHRALYGASWNVLLTSWECHVALPEFVLTCSSTPIVSRGKNVNFGDSNITLYFCPYNLQLLLIPTKQKF